MQNNNIFLVILLNFSLFTKSSISPEILQITNYLRTNIYLHLFNPNKIKFQIYCIKGHIFLNPVS